MNREALIFRSESDKPVDELTENIERVAGEHSFRVLAIHDVQATLAEKGFQREPLKIIEICNAGFAHEALEKDIDVSIFMPCRIVVYSEGGKTKATLSRPSVIADLLPGSKLESLANEVETDIKKILSEAL